MELQPWRSAAPDDLDVPPDDAARVTRPERFHRGLLRREAAREVRSGVAPPATIGNLAVREDPSQEALAVAVENFSHAWNIGGVQPDAEDVHDRAPA